MGSLILPLLPGKEKILIRESALCRVPISISLFSGFSTDGSPVMSRLGFDLSAQDCSLPSILEMAMVPWRQGGGGMIGISR